MTRPSNGKTPLLFLAEIDNAPANINDLNNDFNLNDVLDVNLGTLANGDVPYDAQSKWVNLPAPGVLAANSIDDLGDVTIGSGTNDKHVLIFDYATSQWEIWELDVADINGMTEGF